MRIIFTLLISVLLCGNSFAVDYYVATTGNDTTGDGSIGNPWLTPAHGAASVSTGDTLYIRGGTYDVVTPSPANNSYSGVAPHADNVTIAGYPEETAILRGNSGVAPTNCVIGNGYYDGADHFKNGLTIDNLTIQGMVSMVYASGITLKNSNVSIGGDSWSGVEQGAVVWVQGCTDCTIQNNTIASSYNAPGGTKTAIAVYVAANLTVENNDLTSTVDQALLLKDSIQGAEIRYNYIHDTVGAGIWTANQENNGAISGVNIYQNIFRNTNTGHSDNGAITFSILTDDVDVYNNTFYGNYYDYVHANDTVEDWRWFNNIHANAGQFVRIPYSGNAFSFTYLDYNSYTDASPAWNLYPNTYNSLSTWASGCDALLTGCEANSITTDPGFINASGLYNTPTDFKRSSYTANGRGGVWPAVMGAYITGSETIGYSGAGLPDSECDFDHPSLCLTSETCYAVAGLYWCNEACQVGACAGRKFKVKRIIHPE